MDEALDTRYEFSQASTIFDRFHPSVIEQPIYTWTSAFSPLALQYAEELIKNPVYKKRMLVLDDMSVCYSNFDGASSNDMLVTQSSTKFFHERRWGEIESEVKLSDVIPGDGPGKDALMIDLMKNLRALHGPLYQGSEMWVRFWTIGGDRVKHPHDFPTACINMAGAATLDGLNREFHRQATSLVPPRTWHRSPDLGEDEMRFAAIVYHPRNDPALLKYKNN